jgi:uncharacterized protein
MAEDSKKSYFAGLKAMRTDSNWDGLIGTGPLFSGGGFMNFTTGLGTFGRDKTMQGSFWDPIRITDPELAAMFNGNDLAARIVELKPCEAFRRGYEIVIPDPEGEDEDTQAANTETAEALTEYAEKLDMNTLIRDGWIWGRLFGGDLVIIGADDGNDMAEPLDEDNIKSVKFLNNVDRRFLFALTWYNDPFSPKYGDVETYQVTNSFGSQPNSVVHESRVIRFEGNKVDLLKKRQLVGWTLSVLQRPYDVLRSFSLSFSAVSNMLVDASQSVFKMNGLMEQIASGGKDALQMRMGFVDMSRSSIRSVLIDRENEDYEKVATSFAGIPETLNVQMQRMAAAAEMPLTILFGMSPAGLNATGAADFQHFYDTVASEQKNVLDPRLLRILTLICKAKDGPTGGKVPEGGIELQWKKLQTPTEAEMADIYAKTATADCAYVTAQVLLPEEVALSRFRTGEYSQETEIDVESRKQSMEHNLDFQVQTAEEKAKLGPDGVREAENPPPAPGAP